MKKSMENLEKELKLITRCDLNHNDKVITIFDYSNFCLVSSYLKIFTNKNYNVEFFNIKFSNNEISLLYNLDILRYVYFDNCVFYGLDEKNIHLIHNTKIKIVKPQFSIDYRVNELLERLKDIDSSIYKRIDDKTVISFKLIETNHAIENLRLNFKCFVKLIDNFTKHKEKIKVRIENRSMTMSNWYNYFLNEKNAPLELYSNCYYQHSTEFQEIKTNFIKLYYALNK